jgi:hypothetical protein
MAPLVTVYDAGPARRRPHDVIAPPGGRSGARVPRPGPKALAKWLAGSVRKDPADMIAAAFDEAGVRDPRATCGPGSSSSTAPGTSCASCAPRPPAAGSPSTS